MSNCAGMAAALAAAGAAETVTDADELARAVTRLLTDGQLRAARCAAGTRIAAANLGILDAIIARLAPWIDRFASLQDRVVEGALIESSSGSPGSLRA